MLFFFFNDTATTEIYTLSLHDALPIFHRLGDDGAVVRARPAGCADPRGREQGGLAHEPQHATLGRAKACHAQPRPDLPVPLRSEEHTSELQSRQYLVCRLLLEKKKTHR